MPTNPKIKREVILDTAFALLLEEGYAALSITSLAQRIGCSTQPISWQFGGMEGLRHELFAHCLAFLQKQFVLQGDTARQRVFSIAQGYVNLACDYPHLYCHLYMSDRNRREMGETVRTLRHHSYDELAERLCADCGLSLAAAKQYMTDMELYVHGIASYIAIGFLTISKEEALHRIERMSDALLAAAQKEEESV